MLGGFLVGKSHGRLKYNCDDLWNFKGLCGVLIDSCLVGGGGMGEGEQGKPQTASVSFRVDYGERNQMGMW